MDALKWLCVTVVVVLCAQDMEKLANRNEVCDEICRNEIKASRECQNTCSSSHPLGSSDFVSCLFNCTRLTTGCNLRCVSKANDIESTCSNDCGLEGELPEISGVQSGLQGAENNSQMPADEICYRNCYARLLNATMLNLLNNDQNN